MAPKAPRFIAFEGIDGSGKTTLSRMLESRLQKTGIPVAWLREPSDSSWGKRIRELATTHRALPPREELHLFIEDRKWDVAHNILPALQNGMTVIMDRYYYSNACYQGARGMGMDEIIRQNREFAPEADLVILIDVNTATALARIRRTNRDPALLFEKKAFLEKVRQNYMLLSRWVPNLVKVNGKGSLESVFRSILAASPALAKMAEDPHEG